MVEDESYEQILYCFPRLFYRMGPRLSKICRYALIISILFGVTLYSMSILPAFTTTPPNLVIISSTQILNAGMDNLVRFEIKNFGDTEASLITVSLALPSGTGTPMILKNSDGRWFVGNLTSDHYEYIYSTIYVSPTAANNLFQLVFTINYMQGITAKTETRAIGFNVPAITQLGAFISASLTPLQVKAGQNNSVTLTLKNIGDADAQTISVSLGMPSGAGSSPLILVGSNGKYIFNILAKNQSITIPITIYASPNSAGSIYQITASLTYSDFIKTRQDAQALSLGVPNVGQSSANLETSLLPQNLISGQVNNITLKVTNIGDSAATDLTVTLSLPLQGANSQYTLIGSDGRYSINNLASGASAVIPLQIFVLPSASGTVSYFSVTTSYTDLNYKAKQQTNNLGFLVAGSVELLIISTTTYPQNITLGQPFTITINLINIGTTTAQSMILFPNGTRTIKPFLNQTRFLGDISVNVPSSVSLSYIAQNTSSGIQNLNLEYKYRDNLGRTITSHLDVQVRLTVATSNSASNPTSTDGNLKILAQYARELLVPIIIIAAAVIGGVILIRRRRKRIEQKI